MFYPLMGYDSWTILVITVKVYKEIRNTMCGSYKLYHKLTPYRTLRLLWPATKVFHTLETPLWLHDKQ